MSYDRLGNYIELVDEKNTNGNITKLLGININKEFMPSIANVSQTNLSKYKIIKNNQFAYSSMQTGRDKCIRAVLYSKKRPSIISPAYKVFQVIDENKLLPEFLMMWLLREEADRLGWFYSDSSVRASLEWSVFCDMIIPVPKIDIQKKYVALYNGLLNNMECYDKGLDDLKELCDNFIGNLVVKMQMTPIGDYIEEVNNRNIDERLSNVLGVSTNKELIETKAKLSGVNLKNYKVLGHGEFVFVNDTSRRGNKIALAFNSEDRCLVSSVYTVFRITDYNKLLPQYLFLWFKRSEFDRYARFHSIGSAREVFSWKDMCNVKIPIPDIKTQESIVAIHHVLEERKRINEELKNMISSICLILIKGAENEMMKNL